MAINLIALHGVNMMPINTSSCKCSWLNMNDNSLCTKELKEAIFSVYEDVRMYDHVCGCQLPVNFEHKRFRAFFTQTSRKFKQLFCSVYCEFDISIYIYMSTMSICLPLPLNISNVSSAYRV